jgi:hypothetical protein
MGLASTIISASKHRDEGRINFITYSLSHVGSDLVIAENVPTYWAVPCFKKIRLGKE